MFSWKRPLDLGVKDGRFAPPRRTPNCVSSQADPADRAHYAEPIAFQGPMAALRAAIQSMPGSTLIEEKPGYLYAEFRTRRLRFVDDFELCQDEKSGLVHVRSASRLGRRDFGVNRRRVERLRALLAGG